MPTFSVEPNHRVAFKIRHEDEHLIVVDKPPFIVTQPGLGHDTDTLLNGLFAKWGNQLQKLGKARDFGLLHRLDRHTSGLVIVALTQPAYDAMRERFEGRDIRKFYWALTADAPSKPSGVIKKPILETTGAARSDRPHSGHQRMLKVARINPAGKPAVTAYRILATNPKGTLLECRAVTGRLHQVRAHLSAIGCPILGDEIYAPQSLHKVAARLALHAHRITFKHPITGEPLDVQSPWPTDLRSVLKRLGLPRPEAIEQAHAPDADETT